MSEVYKIYRKRNGSIRYNEWRKERKTGIIKLRRSFILSQRGCKKINSCPGSDIRYYNTKDKSKIMWYVIQVISGNWTIKKHMEKKHAEKYNNI